MTQIALSGSYGRALRLEKLKACISVYREAPHGFWPLSSIYLSIFWKQGQADQLLQPRRRKLKAMHGMRTRHKWMLRRMAILALLVSADGLFGATMDTTISVQVLRRDCCALTFRSQSCKKDRGDRMSSKPRCRCINDCAPDILDSKIRIA